MDTAQQFHAFPNGHVLWKHGDSKGLVLHTRDVQLLVVHLAATKEEVHGVIQQPSLVVRVAQNHIWHVVTGLEEGPGFLQGCINGSGLIWQLQAWVEAAIEIEEWLGARIPSAILGEVHTSSLTKTVEQEARLDVLLFQNLAPTIKRGQELSVEVANNHEADSQKVPLGKFGPHRHGDFRGLVDQHNNVLCEAWATFLPVLVQQVGYGASINESRRRMPNCAIQVLENDAFGLHQSLELLQSLSHGPSLACSSWACNQSSFDLFYEGDELVDGEIGKMLPDWSFILEFVMSHAGRRTPLGWTPEGFFVLDLELRCSTGQSHIFQSIFQTIAQSLRLKVDTIDDCTETLNGSIEFEGFHHL